MGSERRPPVGIRRTGIAVRAATGALLLAALVALCASAPAAQAAPGISARVRAELLKDAKREAAALPRPKRRLRDVQAILTTEAQAWQLENQARGVELPCGNCGTAAVYLVAMLDGPECKHPAGALSSCPTHPPVFMFWVSPSTMAVSRAARGGSYPNLTAIGVPVPLAPPGT